MRTTINLPDGLAEDAKRYARTTGQTFTSVVERGLRAVLDEAASAHEPVVVPSFGDPDQRPLIDLDDREALWAVLDADGAR